ncbi:MAG: hypothetical protein Q8L98_03495 [Chlamydiales bacterium]|nr:hypothetical protein [Chlamydiales bacterium]
MSATNVSSILSRQQSFSSSSIEAANEEPFPILDLPKELYGHICKFLHLQDIQSLACTTKTLRDITQEEANHNQLVAVRIFMETIGSKLVPACPQQITLFDLQDQLLDQEILSLSKLKNKTLMLKDQIIDILSTLGRYDLIDLSEISLPNFCENIFIISTSAAKILALILTQDRDAYCSAMEECKNLVQNGEIERVLKITKGLPEYEQNLVLKGIGEALIENSEFEQAVEVISAMPFKIDQAVLLREIVKVFLQREEFEQALKIAKMMPDPDQLEEARLLRALALRDIVNALTQKGEFEQAAEISKIVRKDLVQILIQDKEFEQAIIVANAIPDERIRGYRLRDIVVALIEDGNLRQAIKVAKTIPEEETRAIALRQIAQALAWNKQFKQAYTIIHASPHGQQQLYALLDLVKILIHYGEFEQAKQVAKIIPSEEERARAFKKIAKAKASSKSST